MKNCNVVYYRFQTLMILGIMMLYVSAFLIMGVTNDFLVESLQIAGIMTILFLPFAMYAAVQWYRYAHATLTNIQKVKLEKVSANWNGQIAFTVDMLVDNQMRTLTTKAIFAPRGFSSLSINQYSMQEVDIGYLEKSNEAVIIGIMHR